jgi:hypothetical protein
MLNLLAAEMLIDRRLVDHCAAGDLAHRGRRTRRWHERPVGISVVLSYNNFFTREVRASRADGRTFGTLAATCTLMELGRSCLGAAAGLGGGRGTTAAVVGSLVATMVAWLVAAGGALRLATWESATRCMKSAIALLFSPPAGPPSKDDSRPSSRAKGGAGFVTLEKMAMPRRVARQEARHQSRGKAAIRGEPRVDSDAKRNTLGRSGSPRKDRIFLPSQRSGHPEAVVAIPTARDAAVAARGAESPRIAVPGTAANDPQTAITVLFRRAVRRRPFIALFIAVLDPLPDVPMHLIAPPGIRSETVNRHGLFSILAMLALSTFLLGPHCVPCTPAKPKRNSASD